MTITSFQQAVVVLLLSAVCGGAAAENLASGSPPIDAWSRNYDSVFIAAGDNPWALPQPYREKPQGPAYQVNPHYVTPEDIEADSLVEPERRRDRRGAGAPDTSDGSSWNVPQQMPYGYNAMPGYGLPGYGGYYGAVPGMDYGAPGFGGNPLLYPYGDGMGLVDPYNPMMQPYVP